MATNFISYLTAGAAAMLLSACNGILSNIYDEPSTDAVSEYGFVSEATTTSPGSIYIDATDYTVWTYIDFRSMTTTALDVNAPVPASWDIAIHRYDTKTNGAEVMETGATSFYSLANVVTPTENDYVSDIWTTTTIVTDMSTMMDGYLSYAESSYNPELSKMAQRRQKLNASDLHSVKQSICHPAFRRHSRWSASGKLHGRARSQRLYDY